MSRNYNSPVKNRRWGYFWPATDPDLAQDQAYIQEWHEQHMPSIPYRVLETEQVELDDIHQEIEEHLKTWADPVELITFVRLNPTEKELKRFGIDGKREIILVPAIVKLVDVGLAILSDGRDPVSDPVIGVKPGDLFDFDGRQFVVLDWHREKYHANTNYPMYIAITGEINREGSHGFDTPVGDNE